MNRKWAITFATITIAGLVLWLLASPAIAVQVLGDGFYANAFPFFSDYEIPLLAIIAAMAGYFMPRGFWLWGLAAVSLRLVANLVFTFHLGLSGLLEPSFGIEEAAGYVLLEIIIQTVVATICTAASLAGASLRWLTRWLLERL